MFTETLTRVTQGYTHHLPVKMIPSIDFSKKMTVKFKAGFQIEIIIPSISFLVAIQYS